jgi:hypothetical protein
MTQPSEANGIKLGSDNDPIRQGLFASQSMRELTQRIKPDNSHSPLQILLKAAILAGEAKNHEARSLLHSILTIPNLETRVQLWVWSSLRELGEKPDEKLAFEILGAVIEVPMNGAYDTLAAYQDGTARYLNHSGKAIFWDTADEKVLGLCAALINSTVPAASKAKPRTSVSLPKSGTQATLLTRSGLYAVPNPPNFVIGPAAGLMNELIRRANLQA